MTFLHRSGAQDGTRVPSPEEPHTQERCACEQEHFNSMFHRVLTPPSRCKIAEDTWRTTTSDFSFCKGQQCSNSQLDAILPRFDLRSRHISLLASLRLYYFLAVKSSACSQGGRCASTRQFYV
eukprot:2166527-Amphidinium_carterae.1